MAADVHPASAPALTPPPTADAGASTSREESVWRWALAVVLLVALGLLITSVVMGADPPPIDPR